LSQFLTLHEIPTSTHREAPPRQSSLILFSLDIAPMLSSTNFWMCFAGLVYLGAGVFILRNELNAARGWDKLIALGSAFFAASLAAFAPEHFYGGPEYIQSMAPPWMPMRSFWPYFVGCALLAGAASLTLRKFVRLSATLLGLMFFLFVCMIYLPSLLAHLGNRFAWTFALRDLSFAAGAWALAGLESRGSSSRQSKWMILFGRIVLAIAVIFFALQHLLHPEFAPGVPSQKVTPGWIPLGPFWSYLTGVVLLIAGVALLINKKARRAAASIGLVMAILTLLLYVPLLVMASQSSQVLEGINYVADTLLFAGAALLVAGALPEDAPLGRGSRAT
jgi:uncharacterized membrane protein